MPKNEDRSSILASSAVTAAVILGAAVLLVLSAGSEPLQKLKVAIMYGLLVLIFLFGSVFLAAIATGKIDISALLEDDAGGASTSRFQLLIFTFVIALSFVVIMASGAKFPEVPPSILALLGISASTYGVSKGIQATVANRTTTPAPQDQSERKTTTDEGPKHNGTESAAQN